MNEKEKRIEGIIREGRLADENVLVDEKFSEELKTELLNNYINLKQSNMEKIKSFLKTTSGKIVAVLSLVLVFFLGYIALNPFVTQDEAPLLVADDQEEVESEDSEVVKIAGMLAIADSEVTIKDELEDGVWYAGSQGETVREGFRIKTGENSKAVVELDDGSAIRLNENTEIFLSSLESDRIVVDQVYGESYHRVEKNELREYIVTNVDDNEDFRVTALGTAFDVSLDEKTVKCLESKVKVQYSKDKPEELVEEGEEFILGDDEGEVKGIEGEDLDNDWYDFNKEKDKEANADLGVFEDEDEPTVVINSPASGSETTSSSVVVKGETDPENDVKLKIRDEWYEVETINGKFEKTVQLAVGKNTIYVKAYSLAGIRTVKTLVVYRVSEDEQSEEPSSTRTFRITSATSPAAGKMSVAWEMVGYGEEDGFKVVFSKNLNPTYPNRSGDYYYYASGGSKRSAAFTHDALKAGGTFHVRVCRYDGTCDIYTQDVTVSVQKVEQVDPGEVSISLSKTMDGNNVNLNWSVTGDITMGFKVVWNTTGMPKYNTDYLDFHYLSNNAARSDTIDLSGNEAGTYYFRVCRYLGKACLSEDYSNQIEVTID